MTKSLSKFLSLNLLNTFLISGLFTIISCQIIQSNNTKSLEGNQGDFLETIGAVFWTLFLTISALTIYLNLIKEVRKTTVLNFLAFFFLPLVLTFLFWLLDTGTTGWTTLFVSTIIFLVTHAFFYMKFLRREKSSLTQSKT